MRQSPLRVLAIASACIALAACAPPRRGGSGAIGGGGGGGAGAGGNGGGGQQGQADGAGDPDVAGGGDEGEGNGDLVRDPGEDADPAGAEAADGEDEDGQAEGADVADADGGDGEAEPVRNASCQQVFACAQECDGEDDDCIDACKETGSEGARADFARLFGCALENECDLSNTDCLGAACGEVGLDCGITPIDPPDGNEDGGDDGDPPEGGDDGDPPEGGGPGDEEGSCNAAIQCGAACGQNDQGCQADCLSSAEGDGRWLLSNVLACQQFTCENDVECVRQSCQEYALACQQGEDGAGLTCGGFFACASIFCVPPGGGAPDQACVGRCQRALGGQAMGPVSDLLGCMQDSGCQDQACIDENCAGESDVCFDR